MNRPHFPVSGRSGAGDPGGFRQRPASLSSLSGSVHSEAPGRTEIENLRLLMQQAPPLSDRRLSELRDRVARGEFTTRAAAEVTAGRMLDEGFDLHAIASDS